MATKATTWLSIDDIKLRTGISDAQLDGRIKGDKLWELAGLLGSYIPYVGRPMRLYSKPTIAVIHEIIFREMH